ncbi:MAG: NHL repeat-containing protein [Chloroflexi bacterium]|nr:NHL repeat-containing protein [Chloroflexota bacterium]
MSTPYKAAVDSSGNIWVADWDNARIARYNSEGVYQTSFGQGVIDSPTGVTIDSSGNFYVSNYWDSRIHKFDSGFNHVLDWGGYGAGDSQFKYPQDVVYNPSNGYIYVMDQWNHKVK